MPNTKPRPRFCAAFLAAMLWTAGAAAGDAVPAELGDADRADIARIEAYLNRLTTMDSRFLQASDEGTAEGRILLDRPGRMRIEYDPPVPVLMVASDLLLMYHDTDLKQTTFLPVSETPAALLIEDRIELMGELTVTGFERSPGSFRVTLAETDAPDTGSVTLMLEDSPLRLVKWRVIDAQGEVVEVALLDPRFDVEFEDADELFSTVDPALGIQ